MGLKELGWNLRLTKEKRTELSNILYETAVVDSKDHKEEEDNFALGIALGNPALGMLMTEDEEFNISFSGNPASFDFDDEELFRTFKIRDKVKLGYREVYRTIYDYIPPDFDKKQFLNKVLTGYRFVSAEKIT